MAGLTTTGLTVYSFEELREIVVQAAKASQPNGLGPDIDTDTSSVLGIVISLWSYQLDLLNQALLDSYDALNPNNATGQLLDIISLITGVTREPATAATETVRFYGTIGTVIPYSATPPPNPQTVTKSSTGDVFAVTEGGTISNIVSDTVDGTAVATTITSGPYIAPLTGMFIADATMFKSGDIVILDRGNPNQESLTIDTIQLLTGSDYVTFTTPTTQNHASAETFEISTYYLGSEFIGVATPASFSQGDWVIIDFGNPNEETLQIAYVSGSLLYFTEDTVKSHADGVSVDINAVDIEVECTIAGLLSISHNQITAFVTGPIGLDYVNNSAGVSDPYQGTEIETDSALRIRRLATLAASAAATVPAIRANLLADVVELTAVLGISNRTLITDATTGQPAKSHWTIIQPTGLTDTVEQLVLSTLYETGVASGIEAWGGRMDVNIVPSISAGGDYTVTLSNPGAPTPSTAAATYTAAPAATVAAICTGLKSAIDLLGFNLTVTDNTTSIDIQSDLGYGGFVVSVAVTNIADTITLTDDAIHRYGLVSYQTDGVVRQELYGFQYVESVRMTAYAELTTTADYPDNGDQQVKDALVALEWTPGQDFETARISSAIDTVAGVTDIKLRIKRHADLAGGGWGFEPAWYSATNSVTVSIEDYEVATLADADITVI